MLEYSFPVKAKNFYKLNKHFSTNTRVLAAHLLVEDMVN
jgi:hypothetical protein